METFSDELADPAEVAQIIADAIDAMHAHARRKAAVKRLRAQFKVLVKKASKNPTLCVPQPKSQPLQFAHFVEAVIRRLGAPLDNS